MPRRICLALMLFSLAAFGVACASGDSSEPADGGGTSSEAPSGGPSDQPSDQPDVNIGTGELPDGFPDSFPLPDGATAVGSASTGGTFVVWFSSASGVDDLSSYFDEELPANGWTIDTEMDFLQDGGSYKAYAISGNGYTGGIYVGEGAPGSEGFEGDFAFWVTLTPS